MQKSGRFRNHLTRLLKGARWPVTGWRLKTLTVGVIYFASVQYLQIRIPPVSRCRIAFDSPHEFVAFSPDERMILTTFKEANGESSTSTGTVWDARLGTCLGQIDALDGDNDGWAIASNSKWLAVLNKARSTIDVHELPGGEVLATTPVGSRPLMPTFGFCPNGDLVVCDCNVEAYRWDWQNRIRTRLVKGPFVDAACFFPQASNNEIMLFMGWNSNDDSKGISLELRRWRDGELVRKLGTFKCGLPTVGCGLQRRIDVSIHGISKHVFVYGSPDGKSIAAMFRRGSFLPEPPAGEVRSASDTLGWTFALEQTAGSSLEGQKSTPADWGFQLDDEHLEPAMRFLRNGHLIRCSKQSIEEVDVATRYVSELMPVRLRESEDADGESVYRVLDDGFNTRFCRITTRRPSDYLPFFDKWKSIYFWMVERGMLASACQLLEIVDSSGHSICELALEEDDFVIPSSCFSPSGHSVAIVDLSKQELTIFDVPWSTNWKLILPLAMIPTAGAAILYLAIAFAFRRSSRTNPCGVTGEWRTQVDFEAA